MVYFLKTMEITWFLPIRAADDRPNIMDSENVDIITRDGNQWGFIRVTLNSDRPDSHLILIIFNLNKSIKGHVGSHHKSKQNNYK